MAPDQAGENREERLHDRKVVEAVTEALMAAWAKAEPEHSVTKYPTSYVATFVDLAHAAITAYNKFQDNDAGEATTTEQHEVLTDENAPATTGARSHRHEDVQERLELLGFVKDETLTGPDTSPAEVWELGQTTVILRVKPGVCDYEERCDEAERLLAPYEQVYARGTMWATA